MARKKEFDPRQALAKAMSVFWRLGYENTSIAVLMREMGIAKQLGLRPYLGGDRGVGSTRSVSKPVSHRAVASCAAMTSREANPQDV